MGSPPRTDERIHILAPSAHDGPVMARVLAEAGLDARVVASVDELCDAVRTGVGALIVADEALTDAAATRRLADLLQAQEPWSALPVLLLSAAHPREARDGPPAVEVLDRAGNVTVLDRPLRIATLLSSARSALRSRRRQYAARAVLTELRTAEAALRESEAELRLADQRKSDFLAILSHELRNPLGPIRSSIHVLERAQPGSELARRGLDVLRRQSDHLTRLIEDLLDITRITHGKIDLRLERLDAREVVARAVEDARHGFEHRGLTLWLSDAAAPCWVEADAARLTQIVANLLHNALKFTPPGGRVEVSLARRATSLDVAVRDTGAGMEPADLERIFDPFVQVGNTESRQDRGLGLGLALVRALAEKQGGRIAAHSPGHGRGTTFVLTLPLAAPPRDAPWSRNEQQSVPPLSILVIEDNEDAGTTLRDLLELHGHEVRLAFDGRDGIESARAKPPDVLLCDVGLPDTSGHEVIRNLRSEPSCAHVFAVALTGYAQPQDREDALAAGFDAHLAKPPPIDELFAVLAEPARRKYVRAVVSGDAASGDPGAPR